MSAAVDVSRSLAVLAGIVVSRRGNMTCSKCKALMSTPTPDEPSWFCEQCGNEVPNTEDKIDYE